MSLGYLDKDYKLNIVVTTKMTHFSPGFIYLKVYHEFYSHLESESDYMRYFPVEWDKLENVNKPENYYYTIRFLKPLSTLRGRAYTFDRGAGMEFVDELRNAFPEYSDKIDYGKW